MPYLRKSSMADQPPERAVDERTLPPPEGDWSDMGDYSEHVKIWLPVRVVQAAGWLAEQYLQSQVVVIRNALIIHVYGRLTFDQLVLHGFLRAPRGYVAQVVDPKQLLCDESAAHSNGRKTEMARQDPVAHRELLHGDYWHSTFALRIAVPKRLKRDLGALASKSGKQVSEYAREVLTAYYLGASPAEE